MKHIRNISLLMIVLCPMLSLAQVLKRAYPDRVFTQQQPSIMKIVIEGDGLYPPYYSPGMCDEFMHVHFKKDGRDEAIPITGTSTFLYEVTIKTTDWLKTPGDLEIYVLDDGYNTTTGKYNPVKSNSVFLKVVDPPANAPVLKEIAGSVMKVGTAKEKYFIGIYGSNFGDVNLTSVTIGGYNAPQYYYREIYGGEMDVWIPAEIIDKPGSYPVVMKNNRGTSNTLIYKIEGIPITILKNQVQTPRINEIKTSPGTNNQSPQVVPPKAYDSIRMHYPVRIGNSVAGIKKPVISRGITAVITGTVTSGARRAAIENAVAQQPGIMFVENQLVLGDTEADVTIQLNTKNVKPQEIDKVKQGLQTVKVAVVQKVL